MNNMDIRVFWIFVLHTCVSSSIPSESWGLPSGVLLSQGKTGHKTDYRCEGENMTIGCSEGDRRIEVVRGNFGRFSIALCNKHGRTDWSVDCMSPSTTKLLKAKCDGLKTCNIEVNSKSFPEDACPKTLKYLEVHYACTPLTSKPEDSIQRIPLAPPVQPIWEESWNSSTPGEVPTTHAPRKPILVTDKTSTPRIPITTPNSIEEEEKSSSTSTTIFTSSSTTTELPHFISTFEPFEIYSGFPSDSSSSITPFDSAQRKRFENLPSYDDRTGVPTAPEDPRESCTPITSRNLQWNWTKKGEFAIQPCPIGTTGLARWFCGLDGQWAHPQPDMSDCKAVSMSKLEAQVRAEDPENVLVSSLAYLTRTKSLYGGDLESAVSIMRTVSNLIQYRLQSRASTFRNKESLITEVLQNILRTVGHILEPSNRRAWTDLSPELQMKVATSLLLALEENAFLLAGVMDSPENTIDSSELLTMAIYVLGSADEGRGAYFPPRQLVYIEDSILLSPQDLRASKSRFNRLAEVVFFSFTNLHQILAKGRIEFTNEAHQLNNVRNTGGEWYINSRVVSAALGRGGRHVELLYPVVVTLKHLSPNMTSPVCVFWNYESHGWSDAGCRLQRTNGTHSVCECEHLTNFALVMRESLPNGTVGIFSSNTSTIVQAISIVAASSIISLIIIVLLVIKFGSSFRNWCKNKGKNCCRKSDPDSGTATSDLEKCARNFYTGLTPHASKLFSPINERSYSQYVQALSGGSGSLLMSSSGGTSSGSSVSSSTLLSSHDSKTKSLRAISSGVPHITLNPYSSQLVDNINMMMPPVNDGNKAEVVYRAVSPHGHVYWEIDPNTYSSLEAPNEALINKSSANLSNLENSTNSRRHQQQLATSLTLFNTLNTLGTPTTASSSFNNTDFNHSVAVPEQLQRQVQIRDIKSIPVSVKSSEYIEAKIRTLRATRPKQMNVNNC